MRRNYEQNDEAVSTAYPASLAPNPMLQRRAVPEVSENNLRRQIYYNIVYTLTISISLSN